MATVPPLDLSGSMAEFLNLLDPDCITRSIALALAEMRVARTADHHAVMAVAEAYIEFIEQWTDDNPPKQIEWKKGGAE